MTPFKRLGAYLNSPLQMTPAQRSMLARKLLEQSQHREGPNSVFGTANAALQGLLQRRSNIADREQQQTTEARQQGLAGALSRTSSDDPYKAEAAKRAAAIISGGLPGDPTAQAILQQQAKNAFAPDAGGESFTLSPGQTRYGPDGKPVVSVAAPDAGGEPFTLSPGQTRYGPDGKPIVSAAPSGDSDSKLPQLVNEISDDLYKESADYTTQLAAMGRIQQSASDPSAAGDLALIFNYMKMLDPNSVVRESEYATAESARGVPATIRNIYNKVINGLKLEDDQRADFLGRSEKLFSQASEDQKQRNGRFLTRATSLGVPREIFEPLLLPLGPAQLGPAQVAQPAQGDINSLLDKYAPASR